MTSLKVFTRAKKEPMEPKRGQIVMHVTFYGKAGEVIERHTTAADRHLSIPPGAISYTVHPSFEEVDQEAQVIRLRK